MHICGVYKNGTYAPICRTGSETAIKRIVMWTQEKAENKMNCEIRTNIYKLYCVK